jgi:hypothetical protein
MTIRLHQPATQPTLADRRHEARILRNLARLASDAGWHGIAAELMGRAKLAVRG